MKDVSLYKLIYKCNEILIRFFMKFDTLILKSTWNRKISVMAQKFWKNKNK